MSITNFRSATTLQDEALRVYRSIVAQSPNPYLVLTPELRIVAANEAYLDATQTSPDRLAGRQMFDAFPDNPEDPLADGVSNLSHSFEQALRFGKRHMMPLQRYDVRDPLGVWRLRYWKPANWPVLDDHGQAIALIHHVLDVTEAALGSARATLGLGLIARAELAADTARRERSRVKDKLRQARLARDQRLTDRRDG